MSDIPTLYKYMPFRKEFFENFYLRCTPRSALNDPFELRPSNQYMFHHTTEVLGNLEFKEGSDESKRWTQGILEKAFKKLGLVSFSETRDSILMWSHYADNHKGIVIEFDPAHKFFDNNPATSRKLGRVSYRKERLKSLPYRWNEIFPESDKTRIYLEKADEWIYEKEYRLICDLYAVNDTLCSTEYYDEKLRHKYPNYTPEPATNEMVSLKDIEARYNVASDLEVLCMLEVPKDCIRSVTCGAMMPQEDKDYVKQKADELGFSYREAVIDDNEYRLNFLG
tara:strand:- start:250 stop:1092 length:843 start_codon:yes stop_codon:yes gene_type:complete